MNLFRREFGAVVAVNMQLLLASGFGFAAWALWPETVEGWRMGVVSILTGLGALAGSLNAVRQLAALLSRRRVLAAYAAQGGAPKAAKLASERDLREAGMLE